MFERAVLMREAGRRGERIRVVRGRMEAEGGAGRYIDWTEG
jgi:hypothetical protein